MGTAIAGCGHSNTLGVVLVLFILLVIIAGSGVFN